MIFRFGEYELDIGLAELRSGKAVLAIEPQVFAVLAFLIENRSRVVSKDELIDGVWHGRIVSDATLNSRINAVRRAVGDDGRAQSVVRTVAKRGFRFVAEVEPDPASTSTFASSREVAAADNGDTRKPSLLVLPLRNLSNDREQDYFADGITEDLTAALAKFGWFFVVGRGTAFAKETDVDVRAFGIELGVDYLLEGTVRRADKRVRVAIHLIDVESGKHLWSDRYDRSLKDVFAVQDDIVANIAYAIEPEISQVEGHRVERKSPDNLTGWDLALKSQRYLYSGTREDVELAVNLARQSVDADPTSAFGHRLLAAGEYAMAMNNWSASSSLSMNSARIASEAALKLDPRDGSVHQIRASIHLAYGEHDAAIDEFDLAIDLNPSLAHAYAGKAAALTFAGRPKESLPLFDEAIRVSPLDPNLSFWRCAQSLTYLMLGEHAKALECARYSLDRKRNWMPTRLFLIATLISDDRVEDAKDQVRELLLMEPDFNIARAAKLSPFARPTDRSRLLDALREAGLPD